MEVTLHGQNRGQNMGGINWKPLVLVKCIMFTCNLCNRNVNCAMQVNISFVFQVCFSILAWCLTPSEFPLQKRRVIPKLERNMQIDESQRLDDLRVSTKPVIPVTVVYMHMDRIITETTLVYILRDNMLPTFTETKHQSRWSLEQFSPIYWVLLL